MTIDERGWGGGGNNEMDAAGGGGGGRRTISRQGSFDHLGFDHHSTC